MTLGNVSTIWERSRERSRDSTTAQTAQTAQKKKPKMLSTATANAVAASAIMQCTQAHIGANSLSQVQAMR